MNTPMLSAGALLLATLVSGPAPGAGSQDPCSATSTVSDVRFALALKDHAPVFQAGEIIPLALSFTSTARKRYWADVRNYDRSGRLGIERYCVDGESSDPLESYFKYGAFLGGGLGGLHELDADPLQAEAELNEWRTPAPGHHRVFAVSYRVWRPPDPGEQTPYRVSEVVRSNTVEFDVLPPDPEWRTEQLRQAVEVLAATASPPEEARHAARRLRFLNTKDSTRELARLWGRVQDQSTGWELMFGLYGSPYPQLAIDSMRAELAAPDHPITGQFLGALVNLQVSSDPAWDQPAGAEQEQAQSFWQRRQAHTRDVMNAEIPALVEALPKKTGRARAVSLHAVLMSVGPDSPLDRAVRPALIAAWADLPADTQRELIQFRWQMIAGPEMLPILRRILAEPPPAWRTDGSMTRDAALKHLYELDPAAGRAAILKDLENPKAQPDPDLLRLLGKDDIAAVLPSAVERIARSEARELDYELLDRYGDAPLQGQVQAAFEEHAGRWACAPQSAMLRYFLRVAPEHGEREVVAALKARSNTGCYHTLLQDLAGGLAKVEDVAVAALDDPDPEVVESAVRALSRWGSADAEKALWARLERFHREWAGREGQLRVTPDFQSPASRGAALEQTLVSGIARGIEWTCPPEKLIRLAGLVVTTGEKQQVEAWTKQWNQGPALINPVWFPEDRPTFSLLQYDGLTEEQLRAKVAQLPKGAALRWQFWPPGQISPPVAMSKQEEAFERVRAAAAGHGLALEKANHP